MAQKSNFQFRPEDYLEWFRNLNYADENRIILPGSQTGGMGLPRNDDSNSGAKEIPLYKRYDLGTSYAKEHVEGHNKATQEAFAANSARVPRQRRGFEQVSTVDGEDFDENEECDEAARVAAYYHYDFTKYDKAALKLPIQEKKKEILEKIENYSVVIIQGETGSGKSTQVPQFILDDAVENDKYVNIIVTQPRRIAAISLANRVCDERDWKVGKLVGYQVGLKRVIDADTRLSFVTTEVLVQKLVRRKTLDQFTHIILDEVHERDQHTDFALLLVKKLLNTVSRNAKIILMSATIDSNKFTNYFSTPIRGHLIPAPHINASDKTVHPLNISYLDSLRSVVPNQPLPPYKDEACILPEMYKFAIHVLKLFDNIERSEQSVNITELPSNRGAVLVFLPGLQEIEKLIELIRKEENLMKWEYYPLHSSLTLEEQRSVFNRAKIGYRKIIASTNIAESSITVPDIKYVIDFCLTKVITCDPVTNFTCLKANWASKASCRQRAGRAGRVSTGFVVRLVEEEFYQNLEEYITPEMCRTPLSSIVLKVKLLNMGEPHSLLALALDPPNMADIRRTILVLKQIGAMTVKKDGIISSLDGDLSYLGEIAAILPIDPHLSKLILMGHFFGYLKETIVIAAALSMKSFHSRPFQDELNAFLSKVSWSYGSSSDCIALLNTYAIWESYSSRGGFGTSAQAEQKWARESYVQLLALKDVHRLVLELTERLEQHKIKDLVPPEEKELGKDTMQFILKICIAAAFYPNYFKKYVPPDYEKEICRELSGNDPFSTVVISNLPESCNILYDQQIKHIFQEFDHEPIIAYEGKRAYVQFPRKKTAKTKPGAHFNDIPGDCPTAMHLAIKMRQIPRFRNIFSVNRLSQEEANRRMAKIQAENRNFKLSERRRTVASSLNTLKPPPMPHPTMQAIKLQLVHVEDACHFWAIPKDPDSCESLSYIQNTIEIELNKKSRRNLDFSRILPKNFCLAPFKDDNAVHEEFFRARIEEVYELEGKAFVFFVDYGNSEKVEMEKLLPLPQALFEIPMLAHKCCLCQVKPASKKNESKWDERANQLTKEYLYQQLDAEIFSVIHDVLRVKLHVPSSGFGFRGRTTLNELLVELGYATHAEEFITSKRNNELRTIYSSDVITESINSQITLTPLKFDDNFQDLGFKTQNKCFLKGPTSPLEMKFTSVTRSGLSKNTRIDYSSINSVALDMQPQSPYERMIVSAIVSLNPSETSLVLHDSTLMPAIPGLLSLCLLLFSPIVELRTNEEGTCYTGAIVGLGCDKRTGQAIYPDDDIEVSFDFMFTDQDLENINDVRYLINTAMEEKQNISLRALKDVQVNLKALILENLLNEERKYFEMENFKYPYKWNCVPPEKLKAPLLEQGLGTLSLIDAIECSENDEAIFSLLKKLHLQARRMEKEKYTPSYIIGTNCPTCGVYLKTFQEMSKHVKEDAKHLDLKNKYGL